MERGSDKHGRRLDEALEKESRGTVQGNHETRGEEWRSAEPAGEDQPDVSRGAGTALGGGTPEGMSEQDLARRAELAALLGKEIWPAQTEQLQQRVRDGDAPDRVVALVDQLSPGRLFVNLAEVWEELTGERESHRF